MSAAISSDLHRLGAGLSVRFTFDAGRMDAEWRPRPPTKRELPRVLNRYRAARAAFLGELARRTGVSVLVLEA